MFLCIGSKKSNPLAKPQKKTHMAMMANYEKMRNLRWPCEHHDMTRSLAKPQKMTHMAMMANYDQVIDCYAQA